MIGSLLKAVVGVMVETPVAIVADCITLGGSLSDKKEPYTATALKKVMKNVTESTEKFP